jgi:methyl-accepting chemotaxis protein
MQHHADTVLARPGALDAAPFAPQGPPRPMTPDASTMDLIRKWLELSELERRAFGALARELNASSDLVETSTLDLSARFQALAEIAQAQSGRVDRIIEVAASVTVAGEAVPVAAAMSAVENVLLKVIDTILSVSKHAMRMVYALDDVARDVAGAEQCAVQIETINRQTRYLALNAAIEASRSGAAGAAFRVIALEMKDLSQATERTSSLVRDRIAAVSRGVRNGHVVLEGIATLDMSEHILAKERIDSLIAGVLAQSKAFGTVLAETAASSAAMAATVSQLITGMQFQDRTKQHIAQVVDALRMLEEGTVAAQQATCAAFPGMFAPGSIDEAQLARIIENQTLGAMKQRVLTRLLTGDTAEQENAPASPAAGAGDVELF